MMPNLSQFKEKNVLVAGASGFIGTNLLNALNDCGANLFGTINNSPLQTDLPNVTLRHCDLTTPAGCKKAMHNIDYAFMCAAKSSGAAVIEKTPLAHLTPNIIMNSLILEAAHEASVEKFCFVSSSTVYPVSELPVTEAEADFVFYEKYHIVGWMKRFSEILCEIYASKLSSPMQTMVVRPANVYGPYDKFTYKDSKVIPALIRRSLEKENPFVIWGDGHDLKDFIYIDDFISGLLTAFTEPTITSPVNISSGKAITVREVAKTILRESDHLNVDLVFDESKPKMIPKRMISNKKLTTSSNWRPLTNIDHGIQKTISWYLEYFANKTPEEMV